MYVKKLIFDIRMSNFCPFLSFLTFLSGFLCQKSQFFLRGFVEYLILGKNQEKKVSEFSQFSRYFGFTGSPVFFSKTVIFLNFFLTYSFLSFKKCNKQKYNIIDPFLKKIELKNKFKIFFLK